MTILDDTHFMEIALGEARKAVGFTSPNPLVGAVVVKDHRIVGKGRHEYPGGPHAEVNAINAAGDMAAGSTLYVTLEPCNHTGRTPPCTEKILAAGIKKVVVAADDPNPDVTGGGNAFLRSRGIPVISGVCEEKAKKQNETYIK
jgi:diaminohydroxyphosphoribosylaminopyrimidine deaminase/5-amino-6-(5-phosphoribosylamino)uracil reductase